MNVRRGKTRKEKLLPKIDEDVAQKKPKVPEERKIVALSRCKE
jgi:hypothetical protein